VLLGGGAYSLCEEFKLQHTATHCHTLQHNTATHCNTHCHTHNNAGRRHGFPARRARAATRCNVLQHNTATHCNIHYNTLSDAGRRYVLAARRNHAGPQYISHYLQHNATHCNTLQHTATHCNTLQHTAAYSATHSTTHTVELTGGSHSLHEEIKLDRNASFTMCAHCNTLQHCNTTHCNTYCNTHYNTHSGAEKRLSLAARRNQAGPQCTYYVCPVQYVATLEHNTLQHTATHTATHSTTHTVELTGGSHSLREEIKLDRNAPLATCAHYNTLQHCNATHCNTHCSTHCSTQYNTHSDVGRRYVLAA